MPLFKKQEIPTKMKILAEEKNMTSKISWKHWTSCFSPSIIFLLVSNFIFETKESLNLRALQEKAFILYNLYYIIFFSQRQFMFVKDFQYNFHHLPKTSKISLLCTNLPPYIWKWVICYASISGVRKCATKVYSKK